MTIEKEFAEKCFEAGRSYQNAEIKFHNTGVNHDNLNFNEFYAQFENEPDIDYHLKKIKAIQTTAFDIEKGNLMARVFIRNAGSRNDQKGNYIINEKDLFAWFENLDYLKSYTEFDTL